MSAAAPGDASWVREGLRFHCTACGKCCTGGPGYVWVSAADVERMARFKGQSVARFTRDNVRKVGERLSLVERDNGDCVLLEGGKCSVYPVKPTPCSTFPFWEGPLASKESWKETAERCEGIGQGPVYTPAEIGRLLQGDARVLLDKQAQAADAGPTDADSERGSGGSPAGRVAPARWAAALAALEALYAELDAELPRTRMTCVASGDCCDFDAFGHRLYVTTLEAEWFFRHAPDPRVNQDARHCPAWGADRLCKARVGRMLGCRTFHCGPYPGARPEDIHEPYLQRIKALHDAHDIPYDYRDIRDWAKERRPVAAPPA